jgi:hypothetical protein
MPSPQPAQSASVLASQLAGQHASAVIEQVVTGL